MFDTNNNHLLHKNAIKLVIAQLPNAIDMDAVGGYYSPYDIEWKNIKILVKVAKQSRKLSQKRAKWFYRVRPMDREVVDYFILFAIVQGKVGAVYVIPKVCVPAAYITITKLDGNMRYEYFRTDLNNLAKKIMKIQSELPKLVRLQRDARTMRGGA